MMHLVEVDVVGLQSAQAAFARGANVICRKPVIVGTFAHFPVHLGGIEEVDPVFECRIHERVAFALTRVRAKVHRPQAEAANFESRASETGILHCHRGLPRPPRPRRYGAAGTRLSRFYSRRQVLRRRMGVDRTGRLRPTPTCNRLQSDPPALARTIAPMSAHNARTLFSVEGHAVCPHKEDSCLPTLPPVPSAYCAILSNFSGMSSRCSPWSSTYTPMRLNVATGIWFSPAWPSGEWIGSTKSGTAWCSISPSMRRCGGRPARRPSSF